MANDHSDDDYNSYTLAAVTTISNASSKMKTEPGINKIYAQVHLNDSYTLKLKVDTDSDTCTLTKLGWQKSQLAVKLTP